MQNVAENRIINIKISQKELLKNFLNFFFCNRLNLQLPGIECHQKIHLNLVSLLSTNTIYAFYNSNPFIQMQFLKTITNLVHQEVTSDVDLNLMQTALKVPVAVLMDGVDLQKLTVIVIDATDSQKSLNLQASLSKHVLLMRRSNCSDPIPPGSPGVRGKYM